MSTLLSGIVLGFGLYAWAKQAKFFLQENFNLVEKIDVT